MPRSSKDNLEIRETRREEILAAAFRVFAEKGYAGSKISEIAAEAGLSHGLVYHYFSSKEAILNAIACDMVDRIEADMDQAQGRAIDRIRAAIEQRCTDLAGPIDPMKMVLHVAMQGSLSEATRTEVQAHFARLAERLKDWIAEAQAAGDVDDEVPADQIMKVLSYAMRGMCLRVQGQSAPPLPLPTSESILRLLLPPPRSGSRSGAAAEKKGQRSDP